jgi:hypothetical protein
MYGRPGVTMGQHLDDFSDWKDDSGRSFDQLIFSILHGGDKASIAPNPRPQTGNVDYLQDIKALRPPPPKPDDKKGVPYQDNMDIDGSIAKLKYSHLD